MLRVICSTGVVDLALVMMCPFGLASELSTVRLDRERRSKQSN
jgi:hypothetical protein